MERLKKTFRRDGLLYSEVARNKFVGLYSVGGHFSDRAIHYEVCIIYIRKDKYGEREALPNNALFGKDLSRCFPTLEQASIYFLELTEGYESLHNSSKVVTEVKEYTELIPEYQLN